MLYILYSISNHLAIPPIQNTEMATRISTLPITILEVQTTTILEGYTTTFPEDEGTISSYELEGNKTISIKVVTMLVNFA